MIQGRPWSGVVNGNWGGAWLWGCVGCSGGSAPSCQAFYAPGTCLACSPLHTYTHPPHAESRGLTGHSSHSALGTISTLAMMAMMAVDGLDLDLVPGAPSCRCWRQPPSAQTPSSTEPLPFPTQPPSPPTSRSSPHLPRPHRHRPPPSAAKAPSPTLALAQMPAAQAPPPQSAGPLLCLGQM